MSRRVSRNDEIIPQTKSSTLERHTRIGMSVDVLKQYIESDASNGLRPLIVLSTVGCGRAGERTLSLSLSLSVLSHFSLHSISI